MGQEVAEDLVVGIGHRGSCKQIKSCCIFKLCLLQFSIINGQCFGGRHLACAYNILRMRAIDSKGELVVDQSFRSSCKQAGSCFGEGMFRLLVSSMNQVSNSFYGFRTADFELICCMCA
ncbi:hypothetical protein HanHA89_Chr11g0439711 [Helianthus annuus]|nr:hypothetical protein HanHA89_Chr11g0439711 [Helianthus annuus]